MESRRPVKAPELGPHHFSQDIRKPAEHGNRCMCRTLALAIGCDPRMLNYNYWRTVLQKHWIVECNHGCQAEPAVANSDLKWHDVGQIDPVKAILIINA
jgi:hypothetical protein